MGDVQYFVVGVDGPGFGDDDDLDEAHWAYMDGFADTLIARGPTLSVDGSQHTGSVHVIERTDAAQAALFAQEEPYARAGWYSSVEVTPVLAGLEGTMWDRPTTRPGEASALVRASFAPGTGTAAERAIQVRGLLEGSRSRPWIYVGVTIGDGGKGDGLVALADGTPDDALQWLVELLAAVPVIRPACTSQRWSRGGRPS